MKVDGVRGWTLERGAWSVELEALDSRSRRRRTRSHGYSDTHSYSSQKILITGQYGKVYVTRDRVDPSCDLRLRAGYCRVYGVGSRVGVGAAHRAGSQPPATHDLDHERSRRSHTQLATVHCTGGWHDSTQTALRWQPGHRGTVWRASAERPPPPLIPPGVRSAAAPRPLT